MAKTKAISNVCHHLRNENDNLFLIYFFELRLTSPVYLIWAERQPERARYTVVRRPEWSAIKSQLLSHGTKAQRPLAYYETMARK